MVAEGIGMDVGFIGLGAMGVGMADHLYKAGLLRVVWNRSVEKARAFAAEHAVDVADSPSQLAERCDLIVICVSADADVLSVMEAMRPGLGAGRIVVDTSTISVETARRAAVVAGEAGAAFLDAPVSGGTEGARNATLVMMVGGDAAVMARAEPALNAMSRLSVLMGPVGAGQATKAVNQIMAAGVNQAVTEALAFGEAMGLDMDKVIDVVASGAAGSWFLSHRGKTMVAEAYGPGFKIALHHKDLKICQDMLDGLGVALPMVEMTLHHYERLMSQGHGDDDISALFEQKRQFFVRPNKKGW